MVITKKEVERIAGLARIQLGEKEKKKFTEELGSILNYINKLNEVNTNSIEPLAQVIGLENVLRQDQPVPVESLAGKADKTEKLTAQFPHRRENYLKVRRVFENND